MSWIENGLQLNEMKKVRFGIEKVTIEMKKVTIDLEILSRYSYE